MTVLNTDTIISDLKAITASMGIEQSDVLREMATITATRILELETERLASTPAEAPETTEAIS